MEAKAAKPTSSVQGTKKGKTMTQRPPVTKRQAPKKAAPKKKEKAQKVVKKGKKDPQRKLRTKAIRQKEEMVQTKAMKENENMDAYQKQTNAKKGFWLDTLGDETYKMLIKMNYSDSVIEKWQKSRMTKSIGLGILGFIAGVVFKQNIIMGGGPAFAMFMYIMEGSKIKGQFAQYKFYRALQFAKFTRLVVPYLRSDSAGGTESRVHSTLASVMTRLDSAEDQQLLATLLNEIAQHPDSKTPYVNYAQKVSDDDFALSFMETLFDIRQGSASLDIIERMSKESNDRIQNLTDDIIQAKTKKFLMFPTKVAMTAIIIIIGITIAILMQNMSGMDLGGVL